MFLKILLKSFRCGTLRKKKGTAKIREKKLGLFMAIICRSKTTFGSFIINTDSAAEIIERVAKGKTRYFNEMKNPNPTLRNKPTVCPTLVIMEKLAKAVAHFCLLSVSMMRRFRGVVDAEVMKEKAAYNNDTRYPEFAKRKETKMPAAAK